MSTSVDNITREEVCTPKPGSGIDLLVHSQKKDLGEFSVLRALPVKDLKKVGPWIFFDHMGPADFSTEQGVNVRPHPHINLATVSYLFEGEIMHRDSLVMWRPLDPATSI